MKIFAYTDAKGISSRESGDKGNIWLSNCPEKYKSYDLCRAFASAPVHYNINRDYWIPRLLSAIEYNEFQAGYGYSTDTWDSAVRWLKIGLYYDCRNASKLGYLRNCVLSEELSPEENIFRQAFSRTNDKEILSQIINTQDIIRIVDELNQVTSIQQDDVVTAIQRRGLRKANDFFEKTPEYIKLNKPILAVFRSAGFDRNIAKHYVQTVVQASNEKYGRNTSLISSFAEIKDCSPVVFTCFFRFGLFSGEIRSRLAKCYFEMTDVQRTDRENDYNEAYICCMGIVNEALEVSRNLTMPIREIKQRKLGELLQKAQFSTMCPGSSISISRDIPCTPYESREIKKSLHWLSEDSDADNEITRIAYFTADISDAFVKEDSPQYICDSNSVIVSNQNPQEHILDYVRHKYSAAGDKELLVGLIRIASKQYELQERWSGTKKEYIIKLAAFRSETDKYINFLCPGYQRGINEATGDTAGSLIPELLQNINDCRSIDNDKNRSLTISINDQEHTMTLTYDELGFQFADVYSITAYGQSTKHDEREGEKGLGFKKVFTVFSQVDIYSNGFSFSLTDRKPTIPQWIEISSTNQQYMQPGKTSMVFKFISPDQTAKRIQSIWENAVNESEEAGLLLGLRNISNYELMTSSGHRNVSRDQLLKKFYVKELPIFETYQKLHVSSIDVFSTLRAGLRTRTKCAVMTDTEFDRYLNQLKIAVYLPMKPIANGTYYSTLPTSQSSGCSMYVDIPLELSTGRNEIMLNSQFNNAIMRMIYYPDGGKCSIMSYLLSCVAKENAECRVYEYISDVEKYMTAIAGDSIENHEIIRNELYNLPMVHTYGQDSLVSVGHIYTAQRIVYDYMHDVGGLSTRYDSWLRNHYSESVPTGSFLASFQDGIKHSLSYFASRVGASRDNYPLCGANNEYTIQYFESEYGTEGGV